MSRPLSTAPAQAAPRQAGEPISGFAREVEELAGRFPGARFAIFPELRPHRSRERFTEADRPIDLPLHQGRIDPSRWTPAGG